MQEISTAQALDEPLYQVIEEPKGVETKSHHNESRRRDKKVGKDLKSRVNKKEIGNNNAISLGDSQKLKDALNTSDLPTSIAKFISENKLKVDDRVRSTTPSIDPSAHPRATSGSSLQSRSETEEFGGFNVGYEVNEMEGESPQKTHVKPTVSQITFQPTNNLSKRLYLLLGTLEDTRSEVKVWGYCSAGPTFYPSQVNINRYIDKFNEILDQFDKNQDAVYIDNDLDKEPQVIAVNNTTGESDSNEKKLDMYNDVSIHEYASIKIQSKLNEGEIDTKAGLLVDESSHNHVKNMADNESNIGTIDSYLNVNETINVVAPMKDQVHKNAEEDIEVVSDIVMRMGRSQLKRKGVSSRGSPVNPNYHSQLF